MFFSPLNPCGQDDEEEPGHSDGTTIAPEFMGHVLLPRGWKELINHKGCSFNPKSILDHGLIAGGKQAKERRQTVFFTPLNPCGKDDEAEAVHGDMTVPRKFHYCSRWRHDQDAVYWRNLKKAQDLVLQFWQTKSNAVIVHDPVLPECIFKVIARVDKKCSTRDCLHRCPHPRLPFAVAGKCSSSNSSSSQPDIASGNRSGIVIVQTLERQFLRRTIKLKLRLFFFNKIELRIDVTPQEAVLQNKMQMKSIS